MIGPLIENRLWDPWDGIRHLQRQMNRLLDRQYPALIEFPAVNIWANEQDVVLTAELPGMAPDDLEISVQNNMVTLKGSLKEEEQLKENERYHREERATGSFQRSWRLPFNVDRDHVEAKLENGVLTLTLPRSEEDKPKKIQIKS